MQILYVLFVGFCLLDLVSSLHDFTTLAISFSVTLPQPNEWHIVMVILFCPLMQFWNAKFEGPLFDHWEGFLASIPGNISWFSH